MTDIVTQGSSRLQSAMIPVRESGQAALEIFHTGVENIREKNGARDLLTEADELVESRLVQFIQTQFPNDGIIGEEGSAIDSKSGWTWTIDPIDGTFNYANGYAHWAVVLAASYDDTPQIGITLDPLRDECWTADNTAFKCNNEAP